jgi:hypothetical protein
MRKKARVIITRLAAGDLCAIRKVEPSLVGVYLSYLQRVALPVWQPWLSLPGLCCDGRVECRGAEEVRWVYYPVRNPPCPPALVGIVRLCHPELVELLSLRLWLGEGLLFPDSHPIADAISRLFGRWELDSVREEERLHTFGPGPGDRSDALVTVQIAPFDLHVWTGDRREAARRHALWESGADDVWTRTRPAAARYVCV